MKTVATSKSVAEFVDSIEDGGRRRDSEILLEMMHRVTDEDPVLWGDSMIGYGRYRYQRANGKEFELFRTGFSPRKGALSIYIMPGYSSYQSILQALGPHKLGKSCLYIKRLADIDLRVLERLVRAGYRDMNRKYPR